MSPGADFGRPDDEPTARLAYVDFDGAEPDEEFLRARCPAAVTAVERIADWIRG